MIKNFLKGKCEEISYIRKMDYIELFDIINFFSFIKETRIFKLIKTRLFMYFPSYYDEYMEEKGLFGRTEFVRSVYKWHKKSKGKQCAIICGDAGSGKSTIIKYFEELPQMRNRCKVITKVGDIPMEDCLDENVVLFFDYAIEMREKIQQLYKKIDGNKKVSLILLERDKTENAFRKGLEEDIELKVFNINKEALLSNEKLAQIINYHYKHRYDKFKKEMILINASDYPRGLEKYVDVLVNKIDPDLRRPIFAVFIGEMLREENIFNIEDIKSQDYICEMYWKTVKSKKKYEKLEQMQKTLIRNDVLDTLIELSQIPILMASILEIDIKISFLNNEKEWNIVKKDSQINEFKTLSDLFQEKFYNLNEIQLNFFLGLESEKEDAIYYRARSGIVEKEDKFDLLIAWLFRNCVKDEKIKKPFLTEAVNCLSVEMKEFFLKKCFRYTEDYAINDACILKYLSNYNDLYKNWSIEQYLSIIKETIRLYIYEEDLEIRNAKQETILKIYKEAQNSLDNISWSVLKRNIEEYLKDNLTNTDLVLWLKLLDEDGTAILSETLKI